MNREALLKQLIAQQRADDCPYARAKYRNEYNAEQRQRKHIAKLKRDNKRQGFMTAPYPLNSKTAVDKPGCEIGLTPAG